MKYNFVHWWILVKYFFHACHTDFAQSPRQLQFLGFQSQFSVPKISWICSKYDLLQFYCPFSESCTVWQKIGQEEKNCFILHTDLSKSNINKICSPNQIFFKENLLKKIQLIFGTENWFWKSKICHFFKGTRICC